MSLCRWSRRSDRLPDHGSELRSLHEPDDAEVSPFLPVRAIEGDGGRADDAEVHVQRLVLVIVPGDVSLQQNDVLQRGLHFGLGIDGAFELVCGGLKGGLRFLQFGVRFGDFRVDGIELGGVGGVLLLDLLLLQTLLLLLLLEHLLLLELLLLLVELLLPLLLLEELLLLLLLLLLLGVSALGGRLGRGSENDAETDGGVEGGPGRVRPHGDLRV